MTVVVSKRLQMEQPIHHPQGNLLALKQSVKMDLQLRQSERKGEQSTGKLKEMERREESGWKNNTASPVLLQRLWRRSMQLRRAPDVTDAVRQGYSA